jgi:hypothetical protein
MADTPRTSTFRMIFVPALITLVVTIVRLIGELQGWDEKYFSRELGGKGALVGIVWLVPIFAIWFAWKLAGEGRGPAARGRALLLVLIGGAVAAGATFGATKMGLSQARVTMVAAVAALVGAWIAGRGWPALARVLFSYGFLARIPVVVVMYLAVQRNWDTHYNKPEVPGATAVQKWIEIGVIPQLGVWIGFTVVVGLLVGALVSFLRRTAAAS